MVDRNNKPPVWDHQTYGPIYVKENAPQGEIVTTVKARLVLRGKQLRFFGCTMHLIYVAQFGSHTACGVVCSKRLFGSELLSQIDYLHCVNR